jgi:PAS domain S-box-containing protein
MLTDNLLKQTSATLTTIKSNEIASKFAESMFSETFSIWNLENQMTQFENPTLWKALGYENREIPIIPPIHPDDLTNLNRTAEKTTGNLGDEFEAIIRFTHFDQRILEFRCTGSRISEREFLLHFAPYFERSEAFEELKKSNQRIRSLLSAVGDSYYILDPNFNVISYFHDPKKIQLFFPKKVTIGKNISDLDFTPELKTRILATLKKAISKRTRVRTTFSAKFDNEQRWFCLDVVLLIDDSDNLVEIACSIQDVSDQKKLEMELSQQTLLRQTLIDHIPGWVICKDYDGKYLFVNKTFAEHIGKPVDYIIGTTDFDYEPDEELANQYRVLDRKVIDTKISSFALLKNVLLANGLRRSLEVTKIPIDILGIDKGAVIVIINDVTENERTTSELTRTKLMLEESNKVAQVGTWELDLAKKTLFWSPTTKLIHEVDSEFEPDLDTAINFYPKGEFREQITKLVTKCIENGEFYDVELKILTAKGNERWVRTVGSSRFEDGKCTTIFGTFQDIDNRKREEERLKLLESVITNTQDVVLIMEVASDSSASQQSPAIVYVNESFVKNTGYKAEEVIGLTPNLLWGENTDRELLLKIRSGMERYENSEADLVYYKKSGEECWINFVMIPVSDKNGKYSHWVAIARDIQNRKTAEIELREVQARLAYKTVILTAISRTTATLLIDRNINEALKETFELIGSSTGVDRVYYFEFDEASRKLSPRTEWTNTGVRSRLGDPRHINFDLHGNHEQIYPLLLDKPIQFAVSEAKLALAKEIMVDYEIKSLLALPIFVKGNFRGIVGFDDCKSERKWADFEIVTFRSLTNIISSALERTENEKLIENSENIFRQINETLTAVFWLYDVASEKYEYISPSCKKILGVGDEYFYKGNSFAKDFALNEIDEQSYSQIRKFEEEDTFNVEFLIRVNDSERWIHENGYAIRDEKGKLLKISGFCTDITETKQKRDQLQHLLNVTGSLNKRLLNFAHIVSHNIRSHSSNLSMLVDFINKSKNQTEQLEYVQMLNLSTQKLAETIDNLNEIVKIQNSFSDERTRVNLHEEFEKTTSVLSSSILETKVVIKNSIPTDVFVDVIPSYLESIFLNLLTNSIKYRSIERVTTIEISTQNTQDFMVVKFSDNGIGINLDMHSHKIFGMYKTFHGNSDARGIGLFMTKNQIEVMGGNIEVESQINVGTTFTISFKQNG